MSLIIKEYKSFYTKEHVPMAVVFAHKKLDIQSDK